MRDALPFAFAGLWDAWKDRRRRRLAANLLDHHDDGAERANGPLADTGARGVGLEVAQRLLGALTQPPERWRINDSPNEMIEIDL